MDSIGERIKEVRKALDMTQEEFAKTLILKRNSLSLIENGKRNTSLRTIQSIVYKFNINEDWIREGKGSMFSDSLKSSNVNKRIQMIRYQFGLTQEEFGEKLGVTKTAISRMELGTYNITDTMFKVISSEFNISEKWLRTGEGDMFLISDSISLDSHAISCGLSNSDIKVIKKFITLYPSIKDILLEITRNED